MNSESHIFRIGFPRRFKHCRATNHRSYNQHDFEIHHFRIGFHWRFESRKARSHRSYKQHEFGIQHFSYRVSLDMSTSAKLEVVEVTSNMTSGNNMFRIGFPRRFNICKARSHRNYKQRGLRTPTFFV